MCSLYSVSLTSLGYLCQWQDVRHDVGKDFLVEVVREEREAEQEQVEDDEEEVKGDESDQDLPEDRFEVHVPSVQHCDRQ